MDSTGNLARKLGVVCSKASNLIDGFEMDDSFSKMLMVIKRCG